MLKIIINLQIFQESQKVPKLTINLAPKKPTEHAFFAVNFYLYPHIYKAAFRLSPFKRFKCPLLSKWTLLTNMDMVDRKKLP